MKQNCVLSYLKPFHKKTEPHLHCNAQGKIFRAWMSQSTHISQSCRGEVNNLITSENNTTIQPGFAQGENCWS